MQINLDNGRSLHYESIDNGATPIIWIHGFTCDGSDWREQIKHFDEGYHHLVVDLNTHGKTPAQEDGLSIEGFAEDIVQLAAALGVENASLVGHSMGCRVSLAALSHPDANFSRAALIDCGLTATPDSLEQMLSLADELYNTGALAQFIEMMFDGMFFDSAFDNLKEPILSRAKQFKAEHAHALAKSVHTWDANSLQKTITELDSPILVVESNTLDENMMRIPLKHNDTTPLLDICSSLTNGSSIDMRVIADAGHFVMLERPQEVNQMLEEFLQI